MWEDSTRASRGDTWGGVTHVRRRWVLIRCASGRPRCPTACGCGVAKQRWAGQQRSSRCDRWASTNLVTGCYVHTHASMFTPIPTPVLVCLSVSFLLPLLVLAWPHLPGPLQRLVLVVPQHQQAGLARLDQGGLHQVPGGERGEKGQSRGRDLHSGAVQQPAQPAAGKRPPLPNSTHTLSAGSLKRGCTR